MKPFALGLTLTLCVAACGDSTAPPAFGALNVHVAIRPVARVFTDTDGVDLLVDHGPPTHLNADFDTVTFARLAVGNHVLELRDVEPNCTLFQPNPGTATVREDSTTIVFLDGICQ